MLFTGNKYQKYGKRIMNCGNDYWNAAEHFDEKINETIPKKFNGKTADKAKEVARAIEEGLKKVADEIYSLGYDIKGIAENNDVD